MSDTLHDGGHGSHGHAGHMYHADSASYNQSLGLDQSHHGHSFLSHLLGLDGNDQAAHMHSHHHQHTAVQVDRTPQGSISWSSALQALRVSNIFHGLQVTPNTLFLLLFVGMGVWLYVVYFVRHHEPLANQVLGTGAAYSAAANADRNIVEGIRTAVPIRTGPTTGEIFVPGSTSTSAATPISMQMRGTSLHAPAPSSAANAATLGASYNLPLRTADGLRLRTVVNR